MAAYFDDLQHDIADARDFILCATREEWDETDITGAQRAWHAAAAAAAEYGPSIEVRMPDLIDSLRDDIRTEIGSWCACIHAEISADNPCVCP